MDRALQNQNPDIFYCDIVHDYPEMGGVCEFSERLFQVLGRRYGSRLVSVRRTMAEAGAAHSHLLYLDRERVAAERIASRHPSSILFFPNFQSPIAKSSGSDWPRIVNVIHDLQFKHLPNLFSIPRRQWLLQTFDETRRNADHVVFISRATMSDYIETVGRPAKHSVIYNPIGDTTVGKRSIIPDEAGDFLLAPFHHHPHKNIALVVEVFHNIALRMPKLDLVFTGYRRHDFNDEIAHLDEAIRRRIRWIGHVPRPELNALYKRAKCYISLSRCEGFNLSAAEAAYHGTRLVLSDLPVHREIFGPHACFVDLGADPSAIADRIMTFLNGKRARSSWKFRTRCDPSFVGKAYGRVIDDVARS